MLKNRSETFTAMVAMATICSFVDQSPRWRLPRIVVLTQFSVPWKPKTGPREYSVPSKAILAGVALLIGAGIGNWATNTFFAGHPLAQLLLVVGPALTGVGAFGLAFVVSMWSTVSETLLRVALGIFLGALFTVPLAVWGVNMLFSWISVDLVASSINDPTLVSYFGGPLTLAELHNAAPFLPAVMTMRAAVPAPPT